MALCWARALHEGKFLETRHWPTSVRGEIYIHASKTHAGIKELDENSHDIATAQSIAAMELVLQLPFKRWKEELPFGSLIAVGNLVECLPAMHALALYPKQRAFGNFQHGRFAHRYENLRAIDPIPMRGAQGFFFADLDHPAPNHAPLHRPISTQTELSL